MEEQGTGGSDAPVVQSKSVSVRADNNDGGKGSTGGEESKHSFNRVAQQPLAVRFD